jgi:hypothetical protein
MAKLRSKWPLLALVLAAGALATFIRLRPSRVPGQVPLEDVDSIDELRAQFNEDAGRIRLILLLSPT